MNAPDPTRALIDRAIEGDRTALERLLLDHYAELVAHVGRRLPNSLRATTGVEDIVQQTFAHVFGCIANFEHRPDATFFNWLSTIAENRLRDALRAEGRKKRGGEFVRNFGWATADDGSAESLLDLLAGSDDTPSQCLARDEAVRAIQVALAGLPNDHREAIQLRYFDGCTLEETAALMNRSPGAVRGLLDRGKQKMRDALARASKYLGSK